MMRWAIDHGDCREVLRDVADNSLDACVTDPPYELGFMGKKWDGSGVAFRIETWVEILRVLKPGAYLLAFGGTRTYHRMACAIEDAGFEVRDSIHWIYGTGMPKGKSVLKPGHEPIVMARKPLIGTVAANVLAHGTGTLNIDACRIEYKSENDKASATPQGATTSRKAAGDGGLGAGFRDTPRGAFERPPQIGRWPTNVILDEDASAELDAQSGIRTSGNAPSGLKRSADKFRNTYGAFAGQETEEDPTYGDTGGASRFFYVTKVTRRERNTGCAIGNNHPTVKPIALMRHLVRLVTPVGGIVLDPFCGSGTTGVAALLEGLRFAGVEQGADYIEIARQRIERAENEIPADHMAPERA